jgi:hypothetical protein
MLAIARQHAPGAELRCQSLWTAPIPPCVAVAAAGEVVCYATEAGTPSRQLLQSRAQDIAAQLAPGGVLILDVAAPGRSGAAGRRQLAWEWTDSFLYLAEVEDPARARVTRTIHSFVRSGQLYRRSKEVHELVLFEPTVVAAALEAAGLAVEQLDGYPDAPRLAGWHAFVATKPRR